MGIRIWLDDVRQPPQGWYDVWVRTAKEAYDLVVTGQVTKISFDHDLGSNYDGKWLADEIEILAMDNKINPIHWDVHSQNPIGRRNIDMAMKSAWRFWEENKEKII